MFITKIFIFHPGDLTYDCHPTLIILTRSLKNSCILSELSEVERISCDIWLFNFLSLPPSSVSSLTFVDFLSLLVSILGS